MLSSNNIAFKKPERIIEHIVKCTKDNKGYFNKFGEFKLGIRPNEKANNCECFVNRAVLGLNFSELVDYRKKELERVFNSLNVELNENKSKLSSLATTNEQVNSKIDEIKNYFIINDQMQTRIEVKPMVNSLNN